MLRRIHSQGLIKFARSSSSGRHQSYLQWRRFHLGSVHDVSGGQVTSYQFSTLMEEAIATREGDLS